MERIDAGGVGNCLFLSLLAGENTPKNPPRSYYEPTTPFENNLSLGARLLPSPSQLWKILSGASAVALRICLEETM